MRAPFRLRDEQGETLLEIIVAVAILGLATVAIMGGLTLTAKVSDVHRKEATAAAYVRNYAEQIESTVAAGNYQAGVTAYAAYSPGSGYTASVVTKNCWVITGVGAAATGSWATCTSGNDIGVQQLTLRIASTDNRAVEQLVVVVRKPCASGLGAC